MGSYWVPSCNLLFSLNAPFHVSSQSPVFPGGTPAHIWGSFLLSRASSGQRLGSCYTSYHRHSKEPSIPKQQHPSFNSCVESPERRHLNLLNLTLPSGEPLHRLAWPLALWSPTEQGSHLSLTALGSSVPAARLPRPTHLDEGVDLHPPALGQSLDLHLADGAHVQMVHGGATPKPAPGRAGERDTSPEGRALLGEAAEPARK